MNVTMLGSGYVGLVSGACFAEFGATVTCVDVDADKIARLQNGELPIYEPGLAALAQTNQSQGRLRFSADHEQAGADSDIIFIAVGTPSRRGDGHADLQYVYQAAEAIAPHLRGYTVIVDKSTVPVGTAAKVKRVIGATNPKADYDVAANPEFMREGTAIKDFMLPDRVVIGVDSQRAARLLRELYRPLNLIEVPMIVTDLESAELIKYASNAFLAAKISFINEMAALCEQVGADVHAVAKGMGMDGRIGRKFLHPGPGYGGSCLPKDLRALVRIAQENNAPCRIAESVIEVNEAQKARMINKIKNALGGGALGDDGDLAGKTIAVLGLTFKPETDDMRAAPSLSILPKLADLGIHIRAHDPQGAAAAAALLPKTVRYHDDIYAICRDVDAVVLMTEWHAYRGLDLARLAELMKTQVFIDLKNVYEPEKMRQSGFDYHCIGRPQ